MKKLFLSLMSLLLVSATAVAETVSMEFYFDADSPMKYADEKTILAQYEIVMLVFYAPEDNGTLDTPTTAPFEIDQCGNAVLKEGYTGTLSAYDFYTGEVVSSGYVALPDSNGILTSGDNPYFMPSFNLDLASQKYYAYWVVLDTRGPDGTCLNPKAEGYVGSPLKYVSYYAASYCALIQGATIPGPGIPTYQVAISCDKTGMSRIDPYPIIPATPITSLTVDNGDGTTTTLTNEEGKLDAALSPTLTDIVFEDDGSVSFTVGELELDYVLYALEIATTLDNGGDWKTADQINVWVDRAGNVVAEDDEAKAEKKTLAEIFGKGYTRWRIEGEKDDRTITIPFIPGSASRFYRIVGEPGAAN